MGLAASNARNLNDAFLCGLAVALLKVSCIPAGIDQWLPLVRRLKRKIQLQVKVDADETRHIFGALDVARHPVNRLCHAAQQGLGFSDHAGPSWVEAASTQVSLLPPPCDEFTTSEPLRNATRVRPPGMTLISLP